MDGQNHKHKGEEVYKKAAEQNEIRERKEDVGADEINNVFSEDIQKEAENIEIIVPEETDVLKDEKKQSLKDKIVNKVISKESLNKKIVELESKLAEKDAKLIEKGHKIQELEAKIKDMESDTLKLIAENRNQRQRLDKEKETAVKYALEGFFKEFIPVKDNFEKALLFAEGDTSAFAEGMRHLNTNLEKAMSKAGLIGYDSIGTQFDPNLHQAIRMVDAQDKEANEIVIEYCRGYQFFDRVLRPAMVEVATGNNPPEQE